MAEVPEELRARVEEAMAEMELVERETIGAESEGHALRNPIGATWYFAYKTAQ